MVRKFRARKNRKKKPLTVRIAKKYRRRTNYPRMIYKYKRSSEFYQGTTISWLAGGNVNNAVVATVDGTRLDTGNGGLSNYTYYFFTSQFNLASVPGYAEWTTLYDQYKIVGVHVKFFCFSTASLTDAPSAGNPSLGAIMATILDYDDAAANGITADGVGMQLMRNYQTYQEKNMLNMRSGIVKRFLRPRIAVAEFSGTFASYGNFKSGWIDSNSPNVQHYGLKGLIELFAPSNVQNSYFYMKPQVTYYLRFRSTR